MKKKEYLQPQIQLLVGGLHTTLIVTSYAIGSEGGEPGPSIKIEDDWTDPGGTGENDDDFIDID
jgi:hypothetical protein